MFVGFFWLIISIESTESANCRIVYPYMLFSIVKNLPKCYNAKNERSITE